MFYEKTLGCYFVFLEKNIPINDFLVDGIHIWPFIRYELMTKMHNVILGRASQDAIQAIEEEGGALLEECYHPKTCIETPPSSFQAWEGTRRPVIIYTRFDEHNRESAQGFRAPLLDGWFDAAAEQGSVLKMEMALSEGMQMVPRARATLFIESNNNKNVEMALKSRELSEFLNVAEDLLNNICVLTEKKFNISIENDLDGIAYDIASLLVQRKMMEKVIEPLRPRLVILTCYYYVSGFALLWACARLGIPVAEAQHCVVGDYQPPYTHWVALPPEGYALLPRWFFVWGESSARQIAGWWPDNGHPHRIQIGGRSDFMEQARDDEETGLAERLAFWARPYRHRILVTFGIKPMDDVVWEAMVKAPRDWLWLLRCHPWGRKKKMRLLHEADLIEWAAGVGLPNIEVEMANESSLATVLSVCDHHVTQISTCAIEALSMGIPTAFVVPTAKNLFSSLLTEEKARLTLTSDELIAAISAGWTGLKRDEQAEMETDSALPRRVLASF
ncbi:hypothetical protein [Pararhodospirillum oryzae]|uniref:Uncharacterized protein n=1 Tax=Pararhodospirillum oryzae TaxID=478448 RepID=A0A512H9N7_9PROT|nr:hypothetical protein [Pararhodospirillum oryzae]GEO82177.1 hypothetical protein ROR02_23080 [Pararhodospirillum oryzae]